MKRLLNFFCSAWTALLVCVSCYDDTQIWDKLNDHENRIKQLEDLCSDLNTNVSALQTIVKALQNNDYITRVVSVTEAGKEVGYTLEFSKSASVTIYHGKNGTDGKDGTDGKNGTNGKTPVVGVAKHTDGVYYWTLDGAWMRDDKGNMIPTTGKDGADGKDGQDGTDGADGNDGADGTDGVTPQFKIKDEYWFISYNGGKSWERLGKATGEQGPQGEEGPQGPQGKPGVGGDSMFNNIYYSSNDYVIFELSNGNTIKVPTWSAFEALKNQCTQMNSNIVALQTLVSALQNNDYISSISPIYEGSKEVGYIINFTKSGKVIIYHGQDGKDGVDGAHGVNGADGKTPVIGVALDTDGIYYWIIDGKWLVDASGNKIPTTGKDGSQGSTGATGSQGPQGEAGADGVTPHLKIENGLWYVSYDNGTNWNELGQATGSQGPQGETGATGSQGKPGVDGSDGDSFFQSVDTSNTDYVSFTLAVGTVFKIPTWSAFEALKNQCEQMNANIQALQTVVAALQNNDYISSITPIYDGVKEIGYIINFTKSGKVTIYHGQDGKDGADGNDGETPIIGVAKGTDGIYYWTVDGKWLVDASGNKIPTTGKNGANGATGPQGSQGEAGADGVTPQLKIESGLWYVSYDSGVSWQGLGQATGDQGPQGTPGVDGDEFFHNVDVSNSQYVVITLADGTQFEIPKYSAVAATLELDKVSGFTATFNGSVIRYSLDLKVTVYYSTVSTLTVYKNKGKASVSDFISDDFTLRLTDLAANTTYYYFTEVICDGQARYGEVQSFRTGEPDSYIEWGEGENIGGDI